MAKDYFTKLMQKGEVDDSYNMRGDKVASSRSRLGKRKDNSKLKPGVPAQHGSAQENDFLKLIQKFTENMNVDIMECDKVPEVVLDFEKKNKNKLN